MLFCYYIVYVFSFDSMLLVLIRAGYVVVLSKNRASRDFSTLKSSALSSFEVGRLAAMQCLLCSHGTASAV